MKDTILIAMEHETPHRYVVSFDYCTADLETAGRIWYVLQLLFKGEAEVKISP